MRILVVEDERKVANFISQGLQEEGHTVEVAKDGEAALDLLENGPPYDLIVLDVMLPRLGGFAVLRAARAARVRSPVLMLTARDAIADKVAGLDAGADDYLTKPFSFDEFLARVRALLRRADGRREPVLKLADLTLDPATREVARRGRRIELTAREHALLEYFLRNPGRVLTRPLLAEHVWGLDFDPESNVVDVYVGYLRRKIDGPGDVRLPLSIHTRLTLWYTGVLLATLVVVSVVGYYLLAWNLAKDVDQSLFTVAEVVRDRSVGADVDSPVERAVRELLGAAGLAQFVQIIDPEGTPRVRSPRMRGRPPLPLSPAARANATRGRATFETRRFERGHDVRVLTLPVFRNDALVEVVQVGMSLAQRERT